MKVEHGEASVWTGYQGTAWGEIYTGEGILNRKTGDLNRHVIAHKTAKYNQLVQITNKSNGKKVRARVKDRGPYVRGRVVDITPYLDEVLELDGLGDVKVEFLKEN